MNPKRRSRLSRLVLPAVLLVLTAMSCDREKPDSRRSTSPATATQPAVQETLSALPVARSDKSPISAGGHESRSELMQVRPRTATRPVEPSQATPGIFPRPGPAQVLSSVPPILSSAASFHPLANAVPGEWVCYTALEGRVVRYMIKDVNAVSVKTEVMVYDQGKPLGMPASREDPVEFDPVERPESGGVEQTSAPVTLSTAGRSWDAILYEDRWLDEGVHYVRRTWVSPAVPVFGIIRMELTGDDTLEARLEFMDAGQTK